MVISDNEITICETGKCWDSSDSDDNHSPFSNAEDLEADWRYNHDPGCFQNGRRSHSRIRQLRHGHIP